MCNKHSRGPVIINESSQGFSTRMGYRALLHALVCSDAYRIITFLPGRLNSANGRYSSSSPITVQYEDLKSPWLVKVGGP